MGDAVDGSGAAAGCCDRRASPERTVFTRLITPQRPEEMPGMWRRFYELARETRERIDPRVLDLMPPLAALAPPASRRQTCYSGFFGRSCRAPEAREADCLIVTGSETDVCVAATALGAVDLGFRVVLVRDAVCSSSDEGHDALLEVYHRRFSLQVETADAETVLSVWQ